VHGVRGRHLCGPSRERQLLELPGWKGAGRAGAGRVPRLRGWAVRGRLRAGEFLHKHAMPPSSSFSFPGIRAWLRWVRL